MIECPKCGFVQPKDRYCANCGVNMESFHAKPPPIYNRIINSPILYVSFFIGAIVILGIIIATQPDSQLAKTAKWVLSAGDEKVETTEVTEYSVNSEPVEAKTEEFSPETTEPSPETTAKTEESSTEEAVEVKAPENLNIEFAEYPRAQLENLYNQSQILAETSDLQVMTLNKNEGLNSVREIESSVNSLSGGKKIKISDNPTQIFNFIYTSEDREDYGLSFQVTLNSVGAENVSIDYEIFLNLKGGEEIPPHNNALSGSYQFPLGSTLILSGILPRQKLSEEASQELQSSPLNIMNSEEFTNPDAQSPSEFLILISVK